MFMDILLLILVQRHMRMPSVHRSSDIRERVHDIPISIKTLLPVIQERLLDAISFVLAKTPYRTTYGVTPLVRPLRNPSTPSMEISGPALTQLALHTLTTFDLQVHLISSLKTILLFTTVVVE